MRLFKSGATRSSSEGKISYFGFRHPLVELSFGKYMLKHQFQEDGKLREPDNWWKGWSKKVSLDSLVRHTEDLQAIYSGLIVIKEKVKGKEITRYLQPEEPPYKSDNAEMVSEEDCVNAIRFNCSSYLLQHLKYGPINKLKYGQISKNRKD